MSMKLIPQLAEILGADELDDDLNPVKPKAEKPKPTKFVSKVLDAEIKRQTDRKQIPNPQQYEKGLLDTVLPKPAGADTARALGERARPVIAKGYGKAVDAATTLFEEALKMEQPLPGVPVSPRTAVRAMTKGIDALDALRGGTQAAALHVAENMDDQSYTRTNLGALKAGARAVKRTLVDEVPEPGFSEALAKRGVQMPGWQGMLADVALDPTNVIPGKVFAAAGLPILRAAQKIDSAATSLRQVPAIFKNAEFRRALMEAAARGEVSVADIGAGAHANLFGDALKELGATHAPFDPFNRAASVVEDVAGVRARKHPVVTSNNVLNVIAEPEVRSRVVQQVADSTADDGRAFFQIYEGDANGVGRETSKGWQNNRRASDYLDEVAQHFEHVEKRGNVIVASRPKRETIVEGLWDEYAPKPTRVPGKKTQGARYVHRSAEDVFPADELTQAKAALPEGFDYAVVKRADDGSYSFIESKNWDTADEPTVGRSVRVSPDGAVVMRQPGKREQIYHHKWEFVRDDYAGFDVAASKARSQAWKALDNVDLNRIGYRDVWDAEVRPRFEQAAEQLNRYGIPLPKDVPEGMQRVRMNYSDHPRGVKHYWEDVRVEKPITPADIEAAKAKYGVDDWSEENIISLIKDERGQRGAVNPLLAADVAGAGVGAAVGAATNEESPWVGAAVGAALGAGGTHLLARNLDPAVRAARAADIAADAAKATEETQELLREGLIRAVPGDKLSNDVGRIALGEPPGRPSSTRYAEGTVKRAEDEARTTVYLRDTVGIKDPNERAVVNQLLENGGRYYEHRRMRTAADGEPISRSWSQAEADSWNLRVKNQLPRGTTLNDSEFMALERQLQGLVERATDIDRDLQALEVAGARGQTDLAKLLIEKWGVHSPAALEIVADQAMHEAMVGLRSIMGARSEAGRALNALKKSVKARKVALDDVEFIKRAEQLGGEGREIRKVLRDLETPEQRYTYLRNRAKATEADIFKWYYISSLLSGPKTHARNVTSNAVKLASMDAGFAINDAGKVLTGRLSFNDYKNELAQVLHGHRVGMVQGWKEAKKVFNRGFSDADALAFAEKPPEVKMSDLFGAGDSERATKYLNLVSRFLEASDTFAQTVAFSGALHAGAYRKASKLVKAGKIKPAQFHQAIDEIIRDPAVVAPELFKEATDFAKEAVYRDAGDLLQKFTSVAHDIDRKFGGAVYGTLDHIPSRPLRVAAKAVASPLANPMTLVMPFIKTPANVFKAQARWAGRGFFSAAKKAKQGQDLLAAVHRGEAVLGVTTLAALGAYALSGDRPIVTGVGPSSPGLADDPAKGLDEYYASQRPNSIRLPGTETWIDYRSFGPATGVLSLLGNFSDAYRMQGNKMNFAAVADVTARQLRSMLSNSFLTGAMGVLSAFEDRTGVAANRTFGRVVAGLLPASGALRTVRQGLDPNLRDTKSDTLAGSIANNVKNVLPGASFSVRPRVGYAGEELKSTANFVSRMVSPFDATRRPEDKIRKELAALGKSAYLVKPSDQLTDELGNPTDLSTLQRADLQKAVGVAQYRAAEHLLASPTFRSAPPELRAKVLRKFMAESRSLAKITYRSQLRSSTTAKP